MKWIKLEDQKPEIGQLVVINFKDNDKSVARYNKSISGECQFMTHLGEGNVKLVTHWIDIPELTTE